MQVWIWPNFSVEEMSSPDLPDSGYNMQPKFMDQLQEARKAAAIPFDVTSGYRTPIHNEKVGGSETSSHLDGWAADIAVNNGYQRLRILKALIQAGFNRIGIGENFIHVDCDPNKNASIWTYY